MSMIDITCVVHGPAGSSGPVAGLRRSTAGGRDVAASVNQVRGSCGNALFCRGRRIASQAVTAVVEIPGDTRRAC